VNLHLQFQQRDERGQHARACGLSFGGEGLGWVRPKELNTDGQDRQDGLQPLLGVTAKAQCGKDEKEGRLKMPKTSLASSCQNHLNRLLLVETHYGSGWHYPENADKVVSNRDLEPIPNFLFRLTGFTPFEDDERRGGMGVIEDPSCRFHKYHLEFSTRHLGTFDFDTQFPVCSLRIFREETTRKTSDDVAFGWGLVRSAGN
jgi:hypothetical protein